MRDIAAFRIQQRESVETEFAEAEAELAKAEALENRDGKNRSDAVASRAMTG